jgi:hypothetical protein
MNIGAVTTGSVASAVWTIATRTITNWGAGIVTVANAVNQTLAAAASIDLRPAAGFYVRAQVGVGGGSLTTPPNLQLNDGTNKANLLPAAVGGGNQTGFFSGDSGVGPLILNNDGAHSGFYMYHLETWKL